MVIINKMTDLALGNYDFLWFDSESDSTFVVEALTSRNEVIPWCLKSNWCEMVAAIGIGDSTILTLILNLVESAYKLLGSSVVTLILDKSNPQLLL